MADLELNSLLQIQPGLGLPDSMRKASDLNASNAAQLDWVDMSRGAPRTVVAERLLGAAAWMLHNQLGDSDYDLVGGRHSITFNYAVEMQGIQLQRSAATTVSAAYPLLVQGGRVCRVSHAGGEVISTKDSLAEGEESLAMHMQGVNAHTSIGVAREALHLQISKNPADLRSVFVRMWLAHLSIRAGDAVEVHVDRARLKGALKNTNAEQECDYARTLTGIRVNARGVDDLTLALFVLGCGTLANVTGLNARASRYKFPSVPLTLYGTNIQTAINVQLNDASLTGSAIIGLAHRYGQVEGCGEALRSALVMFGMHSAGREMRLLCMDPQLHDDTHASNLGECYPYERTTDLGEMRLLSLSLFLGRMWRQSFGHVLRAGLAKVASTDVDAARDSILASHRVLIKQCGGVHTTATSNYPVLIDAVAFGLANYGSLWSERGVAHSIAAGVIVSGSALEEAVRPISVPMVPSLSPVDDPHNTKALRDVWGALTLVDELVLQCGEGLRGSHVARVNNIGNNIMLSNETVQLCGCDVQFTLLSFGSGVTVMRSAKGYSMNPVLGTVSAEPPMPTAFKTPLADTLDYAPARPDRSDIDDLLGQFIPTGSLMSRRRVDPQHTYGGTGNRGATLLVPNNREADVLEGLMKQGAGVVATSGAGLMCGANALQISLADMGVTVSNDAIVAAVRDALTEEETARVEAAGVSVQTHDFTADQLARGLQQLGNYDLVVITENREGAAVYRHGRGTGRAVVVHHDGVNHWSGVGRNCDRPLVVRSARK